MQTGPWHPTFGDIHGYRSGGWFFVPALGLLQSYGSGWYGHFAQRESEWIQTGVIYPAGLFLDNNLPIFHSAHGWIYLSLTTGLHYSWAEDKWFSEW